MSALAEIAVFQRIIPLGIESQLLYRLKGRPYSLLSNLPSFHSYYAFPLLLLSSFLLLFLIGRPRSELQCVYATLLCHFILHQIVDHSMPRWLHFLFESGRRDEYSTNWISDGYKLC